MLKPAQIVGALAAVLLLCACSDRAPETQGPGKGSAPATEIARTAAKPSPPIAVAPPPASTPALAVDAEGLRLFARDSGSARPLPFGTAMPQVLQALAFRGPPGTGTNRECGAGPLAYASWPDGLTLYAQGGAFAGWALDQRAAGALSTAAGIGPGSIRAELEGAYAARVSQTTLGTEFAAGALFGLLDGKGSGARITNMWAGVSCNFR